MLSREKCVFPHYDNAKVHKGKPRSKSPSMASTTSSEKRAIAESKAKYRAEKNKNRQQRDGTPVGDRKKGGVHTLAFAWQFAQQMRTDMSLPTSNKYDELDDDVSNDPNAGGNKVGS